jgi:hypothetical protein
VIFRGFCMYDMLHYAYEHLEECKLILCCSEGTKFAGLIDEMVEIEVEGTHAYQEVLRKLGRPSPHIDPSLEHILITGMFHTFFELIIHEMPLQRCRKLRQRNARLLYSGMDENYGAVMPYNF